MSSQFLPASYVDPGLPGGPSTPGTWITRFSKDFTRMSNANWKSDGLIAVTSDHDGRTVRSANRVNTANITTLDVLNGTGLRFITSIAGAAAYIRWMDIGTTTPDALGHPGLISAADPDRYTEWCQQWIIGSYTAGPNPADLTNFGWSDIAHASGWQLCFLSITKPAGVDSFREVHYIDNVQTLQTVAQSFTYPVLIEMTKIGTGVIVVSYKNSQSTFVDPLSGDLTRYDEMGWYGVPAAAPPTPIRMDPGTEVERFLLMQTSPDGGGGNGIVVQKYRVLTRQPRMLLS